MQIGIVGLPLAGKSTLFQTVTRAYLEASPRPPGGTQHAVMRVPDPRLEALARVFSPRRTTHATVEFVDVAGLQRGEGGRTVFTQDFLRNVKTTDALVQVVRCFEEAAVPRPEGPADEARYLGLFETEFLLHDLALVEARQERIRKQLQKSPDDIQRRELPVLEKCREMLEREIPLRAGTFTPEEVRILRTYQLLSRKPMLIALNLDESQSAETGERERRISARAGGENTIVVSFFGKLELEMAELSEEEARLFMADFGIAQSALATMLQASYGLLGLHSFFTVGEDECRAWTIPRGATAQEAAGAIHSDIAARFIRAEVVSWENFMAAGCSYPRVKEAGQWRLEGKEYVVQNGDVISIRHG
ncbi:MAG: redox-regulated ATPase YchF [Bacteroidota bacterium]